MNQSHPYYNNLILKRALAVLTMVIVLLCGNIANAQGLMRGEANISSEANTPGQDTEMNGSVEGWESPMESSFQSASSAQAAETAESINYLNDDQFGSDLSVHALGHINENEMVFEMRQLIKQNQKLKAELEEKEELRNQIAELENRIKDIQNGWEVIEYINKN